MIHARRQALIRDLAVCMREDFRMGTERARKFLFHLTELQEACEAAWFLSRRGYDVDLSGVSECSDEALEVIGELVSHIFGLKAGRRAHSLIADGILDLVAEHVEVSTLMDKISRLLDLQDALAEERVSHAR